MRSFRVVAVVVLALSIVAGASAGNDNKTPSPRVVCASCDGGYPPGCTGRDASVGGGDWSGNWRWTEHASWCWNSSGYVYNVSVNSYPSVTGAYAFDGSDGIVYTSRGSDGSYSVGTQGRFHWLDPVGYHVTANTCIHMMAGASYASGSFSC